MLTRPKFPREKNVLIINDVPVKREIEDGEKFSSSSNLGILTALRTGRVNVYNSRPVNGYKGILATDINTTYLDYSYYGEEDVADNFDFNKEFRKRKDLKEINLEDTTEVYLVDKDVERLTKKSLPKMIFIKLEHQKDVYISYRLNEQLQALIKEIQTVKPKLIILTGKWSLFFLTGCTSLAQTAGNVKDKKPLGGLVKFRSSVMQPHEVYELDETIIVPIYHPVHAIGMADKVPVMELDIQKLAWMYHTILDKGVAYYIRPDKKHIVNCEKWEILLYLDNLLKRLDEKPTLVSMDIETMYKSYIDCIGITDSIDFGMCIPFCTVSNPNLWSLEDEVEIMCKIKEVMEHPNCLHVGQNYSYECQYYYKLWNIDIVPSYDTMVLHHIMYNYLPKDLAFLASLYCEFYVYWKDDIEATQETPETRWVYNCKDIMYTLEILQVLLDKLHHSDGKLEELYFFQQQKLQPALITTMNRGVRVDKERKDELYKFFSGLMDDIVVKINDVLGMEFNQNSTPQKKKLFSDFMGIELKKKKGGNETCDSKAMLDYINEYPLYKPFLTLLLEYSSLKIFTNNFLGMKLDDDNRARTAYNIAGTATGRLASRKNVWGGGGNFQNIPEKGKINLTYSVQAMEDTEQDDDAYADLYVEGSIVLPNVKKIFLPDDGMEICDADLSGADIMIVAADCECKWLLDFFANPKGKVYKYIAEEFFQKEISDREYKTYKGIFHGTNYGMGTDKLAVTAGISFDLAKQLQDFYFQLNPEVKQWQERIKKDITKKGYIENIFGRRGWFIDKNDVTLYNKAFAFIPQSSIADVVNHGFVNIIEQLPEVQVLMQVHDSIVTQYPKEKAVYYRQRIKECMEIDIPYTPTLIIPADFKVSDISYGDTEKVKESSKVIDPRVYNIEEKRKLETI